MRALVIGASGFVGRHLVAHLREIGDEVVAIDRASGGPDICDAYAITAHVHAANEDAPFRPISPYAASKAAADLVCVQAFLGYGLHVIRARPFTHIGPGQGPGFVASAIASRVAAAERDGGDTVAVGTLTTRRDFTDVRDVVRAYRLLAEHGAPGEAYNICSGTEVSVQFVADTLTGLARRPLRLEQDPALSRPADVPILRGDPARIHELTGWKAEIPIVSTLADLLDDWRERINRY